MSRDGLTPNQRRAIHAWMTSREIGGTVGEDHFKCRGIAPPLPATLRYHHGLPCYVARRYLGVFPMIVALVQDASGSPIGILRIPIDEATGERPSGFAAGALGLGVLRGGALRLAPFAPRLHLAIGLEPALSLLQRERPSGTVWSVVAAWGLRDVALPPEIADVTLSGGGADAEAIELAAVRLAAEGRRVVKIVSPLYAGTAAGTLREE